jgi:hypothetical protein
MAGPFLDPSIILLDPQFTDTFNLIQRAQTVNAFGEVSTTNTTITDVLGVVTPTRPADLLRLPETERGARAVTVFSQQRLNTAVTGRQPDLIQWRGDTFIVKMLLPWVAFGPGWTKAICTSIDSIEAPA